MSRCACDQTGKVILSPSHPSLLIFLALPSAHARPSPPIKDTFSHNHVILSSVQCDITLKVTAIVCGRKTKRETWQPVKTEGLNLFLLFQPQNDLILWPELCHISPDCRHRISVRAWDWFGCWHTVMPVKEKDGVQIQGTVIELPAVG